MLLNWNVSKADHDWIVKIVDRASRLAAANNMPFPQRDIIMDITACHANGTPLKLQELYTADDFNFAHDVFGITKHINRSTGQLEDCFLPRFSR